MFNTERDSNLLRRFTQEDLLASAIKVGLGVTGPAGVIMGEFLTQFVPAQRMDRLTDFMEKLASRISGLEEEFKERLASSAGFAALAEQVSLSAVRTASDEHRSDLASLLKHGLSRPDAEMIEEQALLSLRDQINDAQVLILMSYGNFKRTHNDPELTAFYESHPGLFDVRPPNYGDSPDKQRRWTIREHYTAELSARRLLREMPAVVEGGSAWHEITDLGRLLLRSIGRFRDPHSLPAR